MRRALTQPQGAPSRTCWVMFSTSHLGQVPVAFQQHKWGSSDMLCEQLCSRTLCKGLKCNHSCRTHLLLQWLLSSCYVSSLSATSISPLPHKVTWPMFSSPCAAAVTQQPCSPREQLCPHWRDDPVLFLRPLVLAGADL